MGYACPVCDAPQRDETHLANHLALQAIVHSDDHETWLDDHAPEWASMNAEGLGPVVAEHADEHEFDEVFEDTVDRGHGHDHTHGYEQQQFGGGQSLSGDAARILDEAKDLTRKMYEHDDDGQSDPESGDDAGGDASSTDDADEKES
ncbi:hypothetical protein GJR96_06845 [Haloferax sp. MBLA0076]|uniref:Uncharacterized protein n=1 Tax=Haloferax litoreum TaxID=2666140 RepID=A0A6A8GGR2_9EURY|nr:MULTISPECIES: DUF5810 domain-containing protein [Haloferax]KAB1193176.1 hypothetical protein Hfx1148_06835 [Haloferax sp. CBA1148]MRX21672.1 hypothetical protein [Haloferax litoreum]